MVAWSKPGAAVLTTAGVAGGFSMGDAVGTFMVSAALIALFGVAEIRATGYESSIPVSKVITTSDVATFSLAPFGGFALSLSAITAAIVMGKEAHPDPDKRYTAAVSCGLMCVVIGIFGAAVTSLLAAFPKELVAAIAGLALLGTIGGGLGAAVKDESHREAALITFLVTLSGVVIAGIGSAFWGVVADALRCLYNNTGKPKLNHYKDPHANSFRR